MFSSLSAAFGGNFADQEVAESAGDPKAVAGGGSPIAEVSTPTRRRARPNRKRIERIANPAPGHVAASPLGRGLYVSPSPLLEGLLVANSNSPEEEQADMEIASLLVATRDSLHTLRGSGRKGLAGPQAKKSDGFSSRLRMPTSWAAESEQQTAGWQGSTAMSTLQGAEPGDGSAGEAADLSRDSLSGIPCRRLLSNLPEGSFLRTRRTKALAAREEESAAQRPGQPAPEAPVERAAQIHQHLPASPAPAPATPTPATPASSPSPAPSYSLPSSRSSPSSPWSRLVKTPPEPPRGRGLRPEDGSQKRGYTGDPPSDDLRLAGRARGDEGTVRACQEPCSSGLEIDVGAECLGGDEESAALSPNCLVWVRNQSPKTSGESRAFKRARVLVVDRANSRCKIKPRDGPARVVSLNAVRRFRLKTVFNPEANEVNEIACGPGAVPVAA